MNGAELLSSMGPAVTPSFGLYLWGRDCRPEPHEHLNPSGSNPSVPLGTNLDFALRAERWDELVMIVIAVRVLPTIACALLDPLSSRVDIGLRGRSGWQQKKS